MHNVVSGKKLHGILMGFVLMTILASLTGVSPAAASAVPTAQNSTQSTQTEQKAKYVFLFIGDGMGVAQRDAAELYLATEEGAQTGEWQKTHLLMNTFPAQGMTTTYDAGSVITDSASAGTALATGNKTLSGVVSMDPDKTTAYKTIAETAKENGWKIGIVSSVSLDHATPAVFYAHVASRSSYYSIEEQLVRSKFDYFAGGSFLQPTGKTGTSSNNIDFAKAAGYTVVTTKEDFEALEPGVGMVLAMNETLDTEMAMPYDMDRTEDDLTLADYTAKGIELLENDNGFFMMVEGGKIDWACHANDAAASIHDTLAFDDAIEVAYEFYQQHPDETIIIVTGDHETGGMSIGFAGTQYNSYIGKISDQQNSFSAFNEKFAAFKEETGANASFNDVIPLIEETFGLVVMSDAEAKEAQAAVDQAALEGATDDEKQAGSDAAARLSMRLTDAELDVLKTAFKEQMKDKSDRASDTAAYLLYGGYEPMTIKLTTILNQKAGIGWTTYSHTGTPVQTSAVGAGSDLFNGFYDNTDIYQKMMSVSGLSE